MITCPHEVICVDVLGCVRLLRTSSSAILIRKMSLESYDDSSQIIADQTIEIKCARHDQPKVKLDDSQIKSLPDLAELNF